jgi:hypothetical protein
MGNETLRTGGRRVSVVRHRDAAEEDRKAWGDTLVDEPTSRLGADLFEKRQLCRNNNTGQTRCVVCSHGAARAH